MNRNLVATVVDSINAIWRSSRINGEDPAVREVWWSAIEDLPMPALEAGVQQLSRLEDKFPPTPGQFRSLCLAQARDQASRARWIQERRAAEGALQRRASLPEQELAWCATQAAFTQRIVGGYVRVPAFARDTDFDFALVANAVPAPEPATDAEIDAWRNARARGLAVAPAAHERHVLAFRALRRLFEQEWAIYESGRAAA